MSEAGFGSINPDAPPELAAFDFLIGKWQGRGAFQGDPYEMTWVGRYILGGHAIADEARVLADDGTIERVFITYRFYDPRSGQWVIEYLNVMESTLVEQGQADVGGVEVSEDAITVSSRVGDAITRESYSNRSSDGFSYRMDVSTDGGATWMEGVDSIEARRLAES